MVLYAPLARLSARIPAAAGKLTALDDARTLFSTGAHGLTMMAAYVAALGVDFEVLEPPELVDELAALAARLTRGAGASRRARP